MEPLTCHQVTCEETAAYLCTTDGQYGDTTFLVAEALCYQHHWARHAQASRERHSYRHKVLGPRIALLVPRMFVNGYEVSYEHLAPLHVEVS